MSVNMQKVLSEYKKGASIKALAQKYKLSEKELNEAICKEFTSTASDKAIIDNSKYEQYQKDLEEHNKKVNQEYGRAYEKLKSGEYMEALKLGLSATITYFNAPQNPNLITGTAPCPMKWADIKSIFSLLKSLKNLPKIISDLKNCKSVNQFRTFMTNLVQKLKGSTKPKQAKPKSGAASTPKSGAKTQAQLVKEYSNGKNLIDMTDEELVLYYKKLIPDINKKELKCLIDQIHRIKKGEPRWLNTEEEQDLLRSINDKLIKHQSKKGISRQKYNGNENETADIPFKKRELTDFQRNQLSGWYNKGESECIRPIFDELGTVLDHDVYLYRCVTVRSNGSISAQQKQCDFLNSLKEGEIINNGNNYTSTAKNINNVLDYSKTFGQSYVLKIKIPKGTKVLDMRHFSNSIPGKKEMDEIVLPPCSYKVNKINYTTGVVDCDFIPH